MTSIRTARRNVKARDNRRNPHLRDDQGIKCYHKLIAKLASTYTPAEGSIIEIGAGLGHIPLLLRQDRPDLRISVTDIDQQFLDLIGTKVDLEQAIQLADVAQLVETGKRWDTVVVSHVLEHMHHPYDAIQDIMKILPDGGHAILAVPNPVRPTVFLGNIFKRHYVNKGHVHAWDRSHWINFLEEISQLNVIDYPSDFVPIVPDGLKVRLAKMSKLCASCVSGLEELLARAVPWWSFSNIAVIRK